jgi:hypothetical protein
MEPVQRICIVCNNPIIGLHCYRTLSFHRVCYRTRIIESMEEMTKVKNDLNKCEVDNTGK